MSKLLDILLQRNDAAVPWGFWVCSGKNDGSYPIISTVVSGTLASQYLNVGDRILEIEKRKGDSLSASEINKLIDCGGPSLQLLVEKWPSTAKAFKIIPNVTGKTIEPEIKNHLYETSTEQECVKEKNGVTHSTKIWMRETNRNTSLGGYDLQVNFQRTKYKQNDDLDGGFRKKESEKNKNRERMRVMSENFDKAFREKIGEWLEDNMLDKKEIKRKQQSDISAGNMSGQPPPPPPPSLPGVISGRRLKTEIPERCLEPPAAIQNAMMTKDKKPFTYTPGGIDLSEIRSPRMARRINRNAQAEEMPGIPAPTTNHQVPVENHGNTNYSAMQSQLPSQVLPPVGATPPPPPPPPPPSSGVAPKPPPPPAANPGASAQLTKPTMGRPALPFDPNELFARVNKSPAYEPSVNHHTEPPQNFKNQSAEEKPSFQQQQRPKSSDIGQMFTPKQSEPVRTYVPQVTPKPQNEPAQTFATPMSPRPQNEPLQSHAAPVSSKPSKEPVNSFGFNQGPRGQLNSSSVSPSANSQENSIPSSTPFGCRIQYNNPPVSSPIATTPEPKPQAPWVTVHRSPPSSVPWANREPESPKSGNTRIIPIQVEGRDSPKSPSPSIQSPPPFMQSPPPFMQSQQARQQYATQQSQLMKQQSTTMQTQQIRQPPLSQQQQPPNTRVIPIQIEGATVQQPRSPAAGMPQNKFNPMAPQSPVPYSPSTEKDQKPQWAPVQPKTFKKEPERVPQQQQLPQQPEYGTYNTAGVPVSQLRKMQLSDDDRALMNKFKSQVELHGNDILNDENTNPRYKGGYIPSRIFKMLDESVDDESYLHRESDPRYRGAVIPSRAFRILQSMTDTVGDMQQQQVPRSQPPTTANNRSLGGAQCRQEPPQGSYVPPSEQQVQEPRKYTGGSIPSRSFRMLQAMTGQEVSAPNSTGPSSGRETPVSHLNRWCPSPSPSPVPDPYWACYYPPDPYFVYNYISELNAAYGLPPPPPPSPFGYPRPPPSPFRPPPHYYTMYNNYGSDNDEQGYSSTDELAQYYANYRRNFGYSPYQPNPDRSHQSTPVPFPPKVPRVCVTPVRRKELKKQERMTQESREIKKERERIEIEEREKSLDEDSETETEVDDNEENVEENSEKLNSLLSLKSVSNISFYAAKSSSTLVEEDYRCEEDDLEPGDRNKFEETEQEEDVEEEEEVSTSESFDESEPPEQISHQLSVIFEESEHSEIESIRKLGCNSSVSVSESCSTIGNVDEDDNDLDDDDFCKAESSVTVRLPLKVTCTRLENDEAITTVIVGDSVIERNPNRLSPSPESNYPEEMADSESGDISVTFTLPSRSNSIISSESVLLETKENVLKGNSHKETEEKSEQPEVETEVTIHLSRSQVLSKFHTEEEEEKGKEEQETTINTKQFESSQTEDDSTSTSVQSGETILNQKEDTDGESEEEVEVRVKIKEEVENKVEEVESTDLKVKEVANEVTEEASAHIPVGSYRDSMGRLEELISEMLESTKGRMSVSLDFTDMNCNSEGEYRKKDSLEESEDDSGVTSDMSLKHINSETDGDTESDYSELCKMTQFQRASTHSRLYKLLQEECQKSEKEGEEDKENEEVENVKVESEPYKFDENALMSRKQKLTLPLSHVSHSEVESLSSNSDIASPLSPIVSEKLIKELIHSLLKRKTGKKFRKLSLAKLHAAAQKILQEEMETWDTSPNSGDDASFQSQPKRKSSHSKFSAEPSEEAAFSLPFYDNVYGDNYNDYLNYYDTWSERDHYDSDDKDIVPSRTFRLLRERTNSPMPVEGGPKVRCPRVGATKNNAYESHSERATPVVFARESEPEPESLTFAHKQEIVSKVLKKSLKT